MGTAMQHNGTERIDSGALRRVVTGGIRKFIAAEIEHEGVGNFLRTVGGTILAREPRFYPDRTLGQEVNARAARLGNRTFLRFEQETYSYNDIDDRAARVARALTENGARNGTMIGILLPNLPAFLEIVFASQRIGACTVPINTALKEDGLRYILDNAKIDILFTTSLLLPVFERVAPSLKKRPLVVLVPDYDAPAEGKGTTQYRSLLAAAPQSAPDDRIDPTLPSFLLYTSGTTGHPKGVVYPYGFSQAKLARLSTHLLLDDDEIYYTCLPLFHANALMVTVFHSLYRDAQVVLSRRFSARNFWSEVRQSRATIFNTIGTMVAILMKSAPDPLDREHSVRKVLSAACPADLWTPFQERFGVKLWESFGAVDGGGFATFNLGNAPAGSVGKPLGRVVYRLVGDDGQDAPNGTPGELAHFVGNRKHGKVEYFDDPDATSKKTRDGWLHTGDMFRRDDAGHLFFVGRKTDSMRCGGENVSALEVESIGDKHGDVLESAAFGVPSPMGEQDVMLVVQLRDGQSLSPENLHAFMAERLPKYAVPKFIRIVDQLPKTGTHRTIKHLLKQEGVTQDTWRAPARN